MTNLLKLIPILALTMVGCATASPSNYEFPSGQARSCYSPCQSAYNACVIGCGYHGPLSHHHQSSASLVGVDVLFHSFCAASCKGDLDQCAWGCGAVKRGEAVASSSMRRDPARYEHLRQQDRKMERARMSAQETRTLASSCSSLHQRLSTKPGAACPARETFLTACKELSPAVARCLDPSVMASEAHWCKGQMRNEDSRAASQMNAVLQQCRSKETPRPKATVATRPAARQAVDAEEPR